MNILNVREMKEFDKKATELLGIKEEILMENASIDTYSTLKRRRKLEEDNILIVAGSGNNGGDGLALARKLYSANCKVSILFAGGTDNYSHCARNNYEIIKRIGIKTYVYEEVKDEYDFYNRYTLIIDGIFGISLDRPVEGSYYDIIKEINQGKAYVVSLDIPSGLDSNKGEIKGICIEADMTVAYGSLKLGHILGQGRNCCGEIYLSKISIPDQLYQKNGVELNLPVLLPKRNNNSHKGNFGNILFIGGGSKYYGAPYFNSVAFLKSGGGYSRLACPQGIVNSLAVKANEVVYYPMKESSSGNLSIENLKQILDFCKNMRLVALGGGFSLEEESQRLAQILISKLECPILIDADGLIALSEKMDLLYMRKHPTILTPHLGEMSRLTGLSVENISKNIVEIAREFAKKYRVILVLKDHKTIIAYPDGRCKINDSGNSVLAVAGSGDILTGIIAGQFALGHTLEDACSTGVFIHGYVGDLVSNKLGYDGVMAEDILNTITEAIRNYREDYINLRKSYEVEVI